MTKDNKVFYKCLGFKTNNKITKPLFFFHVPKCAGTTFSVLISHLFKVTFRLSGPLFENNDKGGETGYNNYLKHEKLINKNKLNFLYGHVPFEIYKKLKQNYFFATILRDPVDRCISHYNWCIKRGYISKKENLEKLFNENKIPKNVIVNQFSGLGLEINDSDNSLDLAIDNLYKRIDLVIDTKDTLSLLNLFISYYNLPNLFFQKQQVMQKKIKISKKNIEIIKFYNKKDINLYKYIKKTKLLNSFKKYEKNDLRNNTKFLFSSPDLLLNNKNNLLIDNLQQGILEKKLRNDDYKIINKNIEKRM